LSDQLCRVSWRSRPASFVGLMTLYESNYVRLGWIVTGLRDMTGVLRSRVRGDCDLELTVLEQSTYTTTFTLSYLFATPDGPSRDPELEVRVYHDARLAEARGTAAQPSHAALRALREALPVTVAPRWSTNMLLNKWLEYCADRGHRFATGERAG
jgi:uncharacterized protein YqiB (DUF1249 family)